MLNSAGSYIQFIPRPQGSPSHCIIIHRFTFWCSLWLFFSPAGISALLVLYYLHTHTVRAQRAEPNAVGPQEEVGSRGGHEHVPDRELSRSFRWGGRGVDSHSKVITSLKEICLSQVLVVFYEFSLVKSAFMADIQSVQQYLTQIKVSICTPKDGFAEAYFDPDPLHY